MQTSDTNSLLKTREWSEQEAFKLQLPRNHLHAIALSNVLDERKSATSQNELQRLAERYGVDVWKIQNLARFVSSPSVQGDRVIKTITKEGDENITMTVSHNSYCNLWSLSKSLSPKAVWIEPNISLSDYNSSRSTASV